MYLSFSTYSWFLYKGINLPFLLPHLTELTTEFERGKVICKRGFVNQSRKMIANLAQLTLAFGLLGMHISFFITHDTSQYKRVFLIVLLTFFLFNICRELCFVYGLCFTIVSLIYMFLFDYSG